MKKFLAVLAIAGTLVACDNSGSASTSKDSTDSPAVVTPEPTTVTPSVDSPATSAPVVDSPATTGTQDSAR